MRIAYLGGSFDPVHVGHVGLAVAMRRAAALDVVRLLPAGVPPHKRGRRLAPAHHRLAMLELAVRGLDGIAIDPRELDDREPSYTVRSLEHVAREHPGDELLFVIGMDSLRDLPGWHRIDRLAQLVTFLVAARPGEDDAASREAAAAVPGLRFQVVPTPVWDVSSSDIRRRAARGRSLDGLVPDAVAAYIADHGLYRARERS